MTCALSLVFPLLLAIVVPTASNAQVGTRSSGFDSQTAAEMPAVTLSGKVEIQDDTELQKDVSVVLECGTRERSRTRIDQAGRFTLMLDVKQDSSSWNQVYPQGQGSLMDCNLYAEAPGYRSQGVSLAGENSGGIVDVGTIILHRQATQGALQSSTAIVSVSSLAAPDKAKKQFEKGEEQVKKGKWAAAADYFRRAIQVYPRYALAWLELGRIQVQQNNFADAQEAFRQATTQDSKLLPAYLDLARVQAEQKQWKALADTTARMVQLSPDSSAMFWFFDSAANYNLREFARAESSATRGLRVDQRHDVPQLEYLYGLILATRQDYNSAVQHIRTYIQLAPNGQNIAEAKKYLSDFERLATQTPSSAQK